MSWLSRLFGSKRGHSEQTKSTTIQIDKGAIAEANKVIEEAEKNLFQSLNPDYEDELFDRLLSLPQATLYAIQQRGWARRGTAEHANNFLVWVIGGIYDKTEGTTREEAVNTLVNVFATPDDNTTGWTKLLETATKVLTKYEIREARSKLKVLKGQVKGANVQAIDHALESLN